MLLNGHTKSLATFRSSIRKCVELGKYNSCHPGFGVFLACGQTVDVEYKTWKDAVYYSADACKGV